MWFFIIFAGLCPGVLVATAMLSADRYLECDYEYLRRKKPYLRKIALRYAIVSLAAAAVTIAGLVVSVLSMRSGNYGYFAVLMLLGVTSPIIGQCVGFALKDD